MIDAKAVLTHISEKHGGKQARPLEVKILKDGIKNAVFADRKKGDTFELTPGDANGDTYNDDNGKSITWNDIIQQSTAGVIKFTIV